MFFWGFSVHLAMTAPATPTAIKELVDDLQFTDVTIITVNPDPLVI